MTQITNELCRITIELQDHQRYLSGLELDHYIDHNCVVQKTWKGIRNERYRHDQKEVAVIAQKLLRKETVAFKKQVWLYPAFVGDKPEKRTYESVVDRVIEHDDYRDLFIDLFSHDVDMRRNAYFTLEKIKEKSALEVAFETLDIEHIWVDVEELLDWRAQ
jgi:hypothetical protein